MRFSSESLFAAGVVAVKVLRTAGWAQEHDWASKCLQRSRNGRATAAMARIKREESGDQARAECEVLARRRASGATKRNFPNRTVTLGWR